MAEHKQKIIVVCGATATGKTSLAVEIAREVGAQVVCADSMQIYKRLDIGTAKVTPQEMCGVQHHMLDIAEPSDMFSVADYVAMARPAIANIASGGEVAVVCGGTGLYIDALLDGREFFDLQEDESVKTALAELDNEQLYAALCEQDPTAAANMHCNNRKRLLRALYVIKVTGRRFSELGQEAIPQTAPYDALILRCGYESRDQLYAAINGRVEVMLQRGLLSEARYVYENREKFVTAAAAIGYKELFGYFEGAPLEHCTELLKQSSRRYAKRQLTWFSRYKQAVDALAGDGLTQHLKRQLGEFLH